MYEMRALLQAEAIRRIPLPADRALIDRFETIHDQYCDAVDRHDLKRVCTLNNEFHHTMFSACNNGYLAEMIQRVGSRPSAFAATPSAILYCWCDPGASIQMLDALKVGEPNKLVQLCVEHMLAGIASVQSARTAAGHGSGRRSLTPSRRVALRMIFQV